MNYDEHESAGAFAVDALDAVERAAFERHLRTCPDCQGEVARAGETLAGLSALAEVDPPTTLRAQVLASVAAIAGTATSQAATSEAATSATPTAATAMHSSAGTASSPVPSPDAGPAPGALAAPDRPGATSVTPIRRRPRQVAQWLMAAAAVVAIAVTGLVWRPWSTATPPLTATERVIQATDARRYERTVGGASVTIVRSASLHEAVLLTKDMPPAAEGKTYQLWYQTPTNDMVNAGLMPETAGPNAAVLLLGDAAAATGAGITVEPKGGSTTPTTEPIVVITFA